jgi:hypothetical protein
MKGLSRPGAKVYETPDLGALQAHEVAPARQDLAQAEHRGGRDVHDRAIRVAHSAPAILRAIDAVLLVLFGDVCAPTGERVRGDAGGERLDAPGDLPSTSFLV